MDFKIKTLEELRAEKRQASHQSESRSDERVQASGAERKEGRDKVKKVVLVRRKVSHEPAQSESAQAGGVKRGPQHVGPHTGTKRLKISHHNVVNGERRRGPSQEVGRTSHMHSDVRTLSGTGQDRNVSTSEGRKWGENSSTPSMNPLSPSGDVSSSDERGWSQQRKRSIAEIKTEM